MFFKNAKVGERFWYGNHPMEIEDISDEQRLIWARSLHYEIMTDGPAVFDFDGCLKGARFKVCVCSWKKPLLTKERPGHSKPLHLTCKNCGGAIAAIKEGEGIRTITLYRYTYEWGGPTNPGVRQTDWVNQPWRLVSEFRPVIGGEKRLLHTETKIIEIGDKP